MRRFGNVWCSLGIGTGDVVFARCPRIPEVFCPLFSAFGPEPIATREADVPALRSIDDLARYVEAHHERPRVIMVG